MFTGLSAFPITPFKNEQIDLAAFERLINNLTSAKVDSICAMGSTGLYPYLNRQQMQQIAETTVALSDGIPVMAGVGALRTADVLKNAEVLQHAGVAALLMAPVSYHPLKETEVFSLYERICGEISVPLCVYDNPGVTQFSFSDDLYREISQLPNIAAIKIPGMPFGTDQGAQRLKQLRGLLPQHMAIGVSGDKFGVRGMAAGCDLWLSVLGGLFPKTIKRLIHAAQSDVPSGVSNLVQHLEGIWTLFANHKGGMRVVATAADILGYTEGQNLPHPLSPLQGDDRRVLEEWLMVMQLD